MKIWISIKSILNYLQNNLIDLIWTKKIKFEDNTEMTTASSSGSGADLYDIKLLAQAVADKGWACLSHTSRKDLAKSSVPTVYADILNKYNNAPKSYSDIEEGANINSYGYHGQCSIAQIGNQTFILGSNRYIYYSNSYKSGATWTRLSTVSFNNIFAFKNCLIATTNTHIYKINPTTHTATRILASAFTDEENANGINAKLINGVIYIIKSSKSSSTNAKFKNLYYVADDTETLTASSLTYNKYLCDIEFVNGYWYLFTRNSTSLYIYKGLSLDNLDLDDTSVWEQKYTKTFSDWQGGGQLFYDHNRCMVFCKRYQYQYDYIFTDDDFTNVTAKTASGISVTGDYAKIFYDGTYLYSIRHQDDATRWYLYKCWLSPLNINGGFGSETEFNPILTTNTQLNAMYITFELQLYIIVKSSTCYIYSKSYGATVYTDSYLINGNNVDIKYCMYHNYKICLVDGSNDTNLNTVYNFLGYLNYFRLDIANEKVTLPRNNNLWSYMYVGDDYVDSNLPTTRFYNPITVKQDIIIDSDTITLDIKENKNYKFTNSNISSITFISSRQSPLDTVIIFTAGTLNPVLIDNSGITWYDGVAPTFLSGKTYFILIYNKKGYVREK